MATTIKQLMAWKGPKRRFTPSFGPKVCFLFHVIYFTYSLLALPPLPQQVSRCVKHVSRTSKFFSFLFINHFTNLLHRWSVQLPPQGPNDGSLLFGPFYISYSHVKPLWHISPTMEMVVGASSVFSFYYTLYIANFCILRQYHGISTIMAPPPFTML